MASVLRVRSSSQIRTRPLTSAFVARGASMAAVRTGHIVVACQRHRRQSTCRPRRAEARSARRPARRPDGRRRGGVEPARRLADAAVAEKFVGDHQLRPRVHSATYAIQGNYNGYQVWDISNPAQPVAEDGVLLPRLAERRLGLQESALRLGRGARAAASTAAREGVEGHGEQGAPARPPHLRHQRHRESEERRQRADLPRLAHAHACSSIRRTRTTSTSTSRAPPACARRASCRAASNAPPDEDPNSALFRIEVIKVPLAHPEQAAIVSSPRIFNDLDGPGAPRRAPEDVADATRQIAEAKAKGAFTSR